MDQDSLQSKEAANLATPTVLNVQETSTTAQNVSQDSQLTHDQENVSLKLAAPMDKSSTMELVQISVIQDSSSMKESAFMEDVLMDIAPMLSQDALETFTIPPKEDPVVFQLNSSPMDNVLELVKEDSTLTTQANNVSPAQLTAKLVSLEPTASSALLDTSHTKDSASRPLKPVLPTNMNTTENVYQDVPKELTDKLENAKEFAKTSKHMNSTEFVSEIAQLQ